MADNDIKNLSKEERLELEEQAIQALLQYGVKFSVPLKFEPRKAPKRILLWNKYFPKWAKAWRDERIPTDWNVETVEIADINLGQTKEVYMRNFHIKPLYLGTIDFIRMLSIEIEYNEAELQENPMQESGKMMKYIPLMSKIIAVAALNCCEITDPMYKETKPLAKFFRNHLTGMRLQKLCQIISQMSDKGGFTNSIRLIQQVEATTQPRASRVE